MPNRAGTRDMPRKKKNTASDQSGKRKQFNVSFNPGTAERVEDAAEALGLDAVSLIRMIVHEKLAEYESRAQAAREGKPQE